MNFSDELRQITKDKHQSIEDNAKSHAIENKFIDCVVELIQERCKTEALKGNTHLEGVLYKDSDNDYDIFRSNTVHSFCQGSFILPSGIYHISGFDSFTSIHDLEDDVFIVNELKRRLNLLGFRYFTVRLSYAPKVEEKIQYKHTFWGTTKEIKNTVVHENYWKNLHINVNW